MKHKLTDEIRNQIIMLHEKNISAKEIANLLHIEQSSAYKTIKFDKLAKQGKWDKLSTPTYGGNHKNLYNWVVKKYNHDDKIGGLPDGKSGVVSDTTVYTALPIDNNMNDVMTNYCKSMTELLTNLNKLLEKLL